MTRHGQVNLKWGWLISLTNGQYMLIIFLLYVPKRYFSNVNDGKLRESSSARLLFLHVCLWCHNQFMRETGCVAYHPPPFWANHADNSVNMGIYMIIHIWHALWQNLSNGNLLRQGPLIVLFACLFCRMFSWWRHWRGWNSRCSK